MRRFHLALSVGASVTVRHVTKRETQVSSYYRRDVTSCTGSSIWTSAHVTQRGADQQQVFTGAVTDCNRSTHTFLRGKACRPVIEASSIRSFPVRALSFLGLARSAQAAPVRGVDGRDCPARLGAEAQVPVCFTAERDPTFCFWQPNGCIVIRAVVICNQEVA